MSEKIYERVFVTSGGALVLQGIGKAGIDHAVDFSDMYHYPPDDGIPDGIPSEIKCDMFLGRLRQERSRK